MAVSLNLLHSLSSKEKFKWLFGQFISSLYNTTMVMIPTLTISEKITTWHHVLNTISRRPRTFNFENRMPALR